MEINYKQVVEFIYQTLAMNEDIIKPTRSKESQRIEIPDNLKEMAERYDKSFNNGQNYFFDMIYQVFPDESIKEIDKKSRQIIYDNGFTMYDYPLFKPFVKHLKEVNKIQGNETITHEGSFYVSIYNIHPLVSMACQGLTSFECFIGSYCLTGSEVGSQIETGCKFVMFITDKTKFDNDVYTDNNLKKDVEEVHKDSLYTVNNLRKDTEKVYANHIYK